MMSQEPAGVSALCSLQTARSTDDGEIQSILLAWQVRAGAWGGARCRWSGPLGRGVEITLAPNLLWGEPR